MVRQKKRDELRRKEKKDVGGMGKPQTKEALPYSLDLVRIAAKSNLNPSTLISTAQYRKQSKMKVRTTGWLQFSVFPHPE